MTPAFPLPPRLVRTCFSAASHRLPHLRRRIWERRGHAKPDRRSQRAVCRRPRPRPNQPRCAPPRRRIDSRLEALAEQYAELLGGARGAAGRPYRASRRTGRGRLDLGSDHRRMGLAVATTGLSTVPTGPLSRKSRLCATRYGELLTNVLAATGRDSLEAPLDA